MNIDYSKYSTLDFLADDFFVESVLSPNEQSEGFWQEKIRNNEIDVDEFISAYSITKELNASKPEISEDVLNQLKANILQKSKPLSLTSLISYKSIIQRFTIITGIITLLVITFIKYQQQGVTEPESIIDYVNSRKIHVVDNSKNIQLRTNENQYEIDGADANLKYEPDGTLSINQENLANNTTNNKTADSKTTEQLFTELRVPYGKRAFLTLSDGTKLWVNTGSTVIYPNMFSKKNREIYVDGEIYAEIFHDKSRPFIIKTDDINIDVLGTSLNLTSYKKDMNSQVVLVTGKVNVHSKNGNSAALQPNQMYSYNNGYSAISTVNVENYISWKDGIYIFNNESIENILLRLARHYNVTMILPVKKSGITCSGKLVLKDDLNHLLNGLIEITSLNYGIKNDTYTIYFPTNHTNK